MILILELPFILLNYLEQIAVYTINDFNFIAASCCELSYKKDREWYFVA